MIYKIKSTRHKKYDQDGKIGLELRINIEPLVYKLENNFYRIKNASLKMEKLPISYTLSAFIFKHFSPIYNNYKCGWKRILVGYSLMLK